MTEIVDKETGEIIEAAESKDPTLHEMIDTFIRLRDKKTEIVKAQKQALKQYDEAMDEIGLYLKGWLADQKVNAISCDAGVAFIRRKRSATVADTGTFREYVIANKFFELADFRANVEAVEGYVSEHDGQLPPGANYRSFDAVSVNRK
jgi:hypothetical protein